MDSMFYSAGYLGFLFEGTLADFENSLTAGA